MTSLYSNQYIYSIVQTADTYPVLSRDTLTHKPYKKQNILYQEVEPHPCTKLMHIHTHPVLFVDITWTCVNLVNLQWLTFQVLSLLCQSCW